MKKVAIPFNKWLWDLAERMNWNDRWPRSFWLWLLKRMDKAHGYHLEYDEDEEGSDPA